MKTILGPLGAALSVFNAVISYKHGNMDAVLGWSCSVCWAVAYWSMQRD